MDAFRNGEMGSEFNRPIVQSFNIGGHIHKSSGSSIGSLLNAFPKPSIHGSIIP